MITTVSFKDWNDVVRDKDAIPETEYRVTRHHRKTSKVVDVTLKPVVDALLSSIGKNK